MRIGWQATERFDMSLIGRELLHARHAEFAGGAHSPDIFSAKSR